MTILFLDQFSDLGGAQRCLLELLPAVEQAGWKAHAALPGDGKFAGLLRQRGVETHGISLGKYSLGRKSLLDGVRFLSDRSRVAGEIRDLAAGLDAAVVYVNGPRLMPAVARARLGRRVVFHCHNYVSGRNGRRLVASAIRRTGATIIAASEYLARQWNRPAHVVYGGVEGPGAGWRRVPRSSGPRAGLIGRFAPQKCQKEFVLAAARLAGEIPEAEFYLCGDALFGDRAAQRYKEKVLAAAPPSVRYLGWRDDVYELLANLELLVVPSTAEGGVPSIILEAFAARVPVLASPEGGIPEVIQDNWNGFLLASPQAPAIAERLRELLPQTDRLAGVAERAHRYWQERLTAERYRRQVWEAIGL